jgi:hypothetical protein
MSNAIPYKFPSIISETLENGLQLTLLEDHEQEGVTVAFQMPFGEFCDPISFEGATELTVGAILKGPLSLTPGMNDAYLAVKCFPNFSILLYRYSGKC